MMVLDYCQSPPCYREIYEDPRVSASGPSDPVCKTRIIVETTGGPVSISADEKTGSCQYVFVIQSGSDTKAPSLDEWGRAMFLDATYRFAASNRIREAVDWIIDKLDDTLNAGQFNDCNGILRAASVEKLDDPLIVTFLGITAAAKDRLRSRAAFYFRALQIVSERRGAEGAEKLLSKYR